jgi:FtsH-binding integral membrane protein
VGLTAFTFQSKIQFTFMRAGIFAFIWVFILWGMMISIIGFGNYQVYCLFGAMLMCFLIVFDTARLTGKYIDTDESMLASVELYLDFINLFLYILSLLGNRR